MQHCFLVAKSQLYFLRYHHCVLGLISLQEITVGTDVGSGTDHGPSPIDHALKIVRLCEMTQMALLLVAIIARRNCVSCIPVQSFAAVAAIVVINAIVVAAVAICTLAVSVVAVSHDVGTRWARVREIVGATTRGRT